MAQKKAELTSPFQFVELLLLCFAHLDHVLY